MNEKDKERAQRFGAYIRALREFNSLEHYGHTTEEALQAAQIQLDNLFNGTIKGS